MGNPSESDLKDESITSEEFGPKKLGDYEYTPLLRALPVNPGAIATGPEYTPLRTDFYVFSLQQPDDGKFAFRQGLPAVLQH